MDSKIILLIMVLISLNLTEARSPLQFSGRSLLSKDQRAALLKLVQGPRARLSTNVKKSQSVKSTNNVVEPKDSNKEVQSRISDDIDLSQLDSEGCMKKVVMVEEVEFDTEIKCQHVSQESCFESYTTTLKKTESEECDESFKKECEIEYHKVPKEEKVEICNEMLTRDCEMDGPQVCSKEYETVCETIYEEHTVEEMVPDCKTEIEEVCMTDDTGEEWCDNVPKRDCKIVTKPSVKLTPQTECRKEVAQVCGPETCPIVKGDRICKDEIKTVIHEVPQESCNMVPRKVCNIVSKVVPTLEPVKHCIDIPKEMCAKSRINPVRKKKPVVRKWCLNDREDSDGGENGNEKLPNVVYALMVDEKLSESQSSLEARLLDTTTGATLCSKKFTPSENDITRIPIQLSYALMGNNRQLVSCGHENYACKALNVNDGSVTTFESASGPGRFSASFMDTEVDNSWLTFLGFDENDRKEVVTHAIGLDADLSTGTPFVSSPFNDLDTLKERLTGRGCMLKFAGPDGKPVEFYAANFLRSGIVYMVKCPSKNIGPLPCLGHYILAERQLIYVKYDDKVAINDALFNAFLGQQPICGYAVRTEDGNGEVTGDTRVYFFHGVSAHTRVFMKSLLIPTSSSDRMTDFFDKDKVGNTFRIRHEVLTSIADSELVYNENESGRAASTVWMGDNRSLVLVSSGPSLAMFDANANSLTLMDDTDSADKGTLLFTTRATEADKVNLGCSET